MLDSNSDTDDCPFDMSSVAESLKSAREAMGWSCRTAVQKLPNDCSISHTTLTKYERGAAPPNTRVLAGLCLIYEIKMESLFKRGTYLKGIRYRNLKSRVKKSELTRYEAQSTKWLNAYVAAERHFGSRLSASISFDIDPLESPAAQAASLRHELGISDDQPIASVVEILEALGVRVIEVDTESAIDGLSAQFGEDYAVVLKPSVSNDRARMNAGHELGHVVRGDCVEGEEETKDSHAAAFEFSSHFLLTSKMLQKAFERKSMVRLVDFKERFGISLAAMVFRAEQEGLITTPMAKRLWTEFAKRGWRKHEPGSVRADRAVRFESLLDSALVESNYTMESLSDLLCVRKDELRDRFSIAMGAEEIEEEGGNSETEFTLKLRR